MDVEACHLLFDNQFDSLFSIVGLKADEIYAVLQTIETDAFKVLVDAQYTLSQDVEHFHLKNRPFHMKDVIGRIRINLGFLSVFMDSIPNHGHREWL